MTSRKEYSDYLWGYLCRLFSFPRWTGSSFFYLFSLKNWQQSHLYPNAPSHYTTYYTELFIHCRTCMSTLTERYMNRGLMKCPICKEPVDATDKDIPHYSRQKSVVDEQTPCERDADSDDQGMITIIMLDMWGREEKQWQEQETDTFCMASYHEISLYKD